MHIEVTHSYFLIWPKMVNLSRCLGSTRVTKVNQLLQGLANTSNTGRVWTDATGKLQALKNTANQDLLKKFLKKISVPHTGPKREVEKRLQGAIEKMHQTVVAYIYQETEKHFGMEDSYARKINFTQRRLSAVKIRKAEENVRK